MAYRQLCAVTFALLGLVAAGCGGGTSSSVKADDPEQQPPANPDQAPNNTGDAASNPDSTPRNPDAPPSSSEDPAGSGGGGRLTALCHQLCSALSTLANDCNLDAGMGMGEMDEVCAADVNCQVPANLPCQNELADAFQCIVDNLALVCADDNQGAPGAPAAQPCRDVTRELTQCTGDGEPVDEGPGNEGNCTAAGGCERCANACATCTCEAGTDAEELQACGTVCAMP